MPLPERIASTRPRESPGGSRLPARRRPSARLRRRPRTWLGHTRTNWPGHTDEPGPDTRTNLAPESAPESSPRVGRTGPDTRALALARTHESGQTNEPHERTWPLSQPQSRTHGLAGPDTRALGHTDEPGPDTRTNLAPESAPESDTRTCRPCAGPDTRTNLARTHERTWPLSQPQSRAPRVGRTGPDTRALASPDKRTNLTNEPGP